jgi:hypothetical protein
VDLNIHHEAIPVPSTACPLCDNDFHLFKQGLNSLSKSGDLPEGYGVTHTELGTDGFNEQEEINIGLQRKEYPIKLPWQIWQPQTDLWAQGLYVLTTILSLSQ